MKIKLRPWLQKILFLHLDLWPWSVAGSPLSMLTAGGTGGRRNDPGPPDDKALSLSRFHHEPVMLAEAMKYLQPGPGKLYVDATLGGGGHSEALLRAGAAVLGFDQDPAAIESTCARLSGNEDRFVGLHMNFRRCAEVLEETGVGRVDGIFGDLGVSSHQLDVAERGFSFQQNGPLDMRMNTSSGRTAADIVNDSSAEELQRIFREYGEEPLARRAANAIVRRREQHLFHETLDLANTLAAILPRRGKTHPATRVFQALRIETNDELGALRDLLADAPRILKPGGRIVLLCFHSLESRMVKQAFHRCSVEWLDRPEWPEPRKNPDYSMRLLTNKPVEPSAEEVSENHRARSVSLRAAERLPA